MSEILSFLYETDVKHLFAKARGGNATCLTKFLLGEECRLPKSGLLPHIILKASRMAQESAWDMDAISKDHVAQLAEHIRIRYQISHFQLTIKDGYDVLEAFLSPLAQPESESEIDVDPETDEELEQQLLKQAERLNQKAEQLREIGKKNSDRITKIESKLKKRSAKNNFHP